MFSYDKNEIFVLIPAAGSGSRMNQKKNKQFIKINGEPVISRTMQTFCQHPDITGIILIASANEVRELEKLAEIYDWSKLINITTGGKTRHASVYNGLRALKHMLTRKANMTESSELTGELPDDLSDKLTGPESDRHSEPIILIHDGARCFADNQLIDRVIAGIKLHQACGAGLPVKDTIKTVNGDGKIDKTLDRIRLWGMQTPQGAFYSLILSAYELADQSCYDGTDDLSILEHSGIDTHVVEGSAFNIKITTPFDLLTAKAICQTLKT